jgi:hypothetical protein
MELVEPADDYVLPPIEMVRVSRLSRSADKFERSEGESVRFLLKALTPNSG